MYYFNRVVYREDLVKLKEQMQAKRKQEQDSDDEDTKTGAIKKVPKKRHGVKSSAKEGRKDEPPKTSLTLEFVHG